MPAFRSKKILAIAPLALLAAVLVFLWYRTQDRRLSDVPQRSAQELTVPERTSSLQVKLAIPHEVLARVVGREMPERMRFSGRGDDLCVDLRVTKPCVGTRYGATVEKLGRTAVEREGSDLSVFCPSPSTATGGSAVTWRG